MIPIHDLPRDFQTWLDEVASDNVVVDTESYKEASANMWSFSLEPSNAAYVTKEHVLSFIENVITIRARQTILRGHGNSMLFYTWVDDAAGRLCFSMISSKHGTRLPFKCRVNSHASLEDIAAQFVNSSYLGGIPLHEFSEMPSEVNSTTGRTADQKSLDVHVRRLGAE
jgi:hypothetical protein